MSFIVDLWESIFTPGTSPALIKATHASFVLLIISLSWSFYVSRSIHFFNLLIIATLLYASVIWFINELKHFKLKEGTEQTDDKSEESREGKSTGSFIVDGKELKVTKRKT